MGTRLDCERKLLFAPGLCMVVCRMIWAKRTNLQVLTIAIAVICKVLFMQNKNNHSSQIKHMDLRKLTKKKKKYS